MVRIIGAPFDLCGRRLGSRLGPIAVRLEGLTAGLQRLGQDVEDVGAVIDLDASTGDKHARALATYENTRDEVAKACRDGRAPIVLGGDHSLSIGSVAGALRHFGEGLAVLWIDAHIDLNTPDTSPSGNLHGMPLAALTGMQTASEGELAALWGRLGEIVGPTKLDAKRLAWLGLRDVDSGEVYNLRQAPGSLPLTMQDVDLMGTAACVRKAIDHVVANGATALWVSFDVDCLDPIFAPGTGTAVRGGFTYREGHLIAESLHEAIFKDKRIALAGLDVVEVNPLADRNNETANVAMEWVFSFFGKTILHPADPGRTER